MKLSYFAILLMSVLVHVHSEKTQLDIVVEKLEESFKETATILFIQIKTITQKENINIVNKSTTVIKNELMGIKKQLIKTFKMEYFQYLKTSEKNDLIQLNECLIYSIENTPKGINKFLKFGINNLFDKLNPDVQGYILNIGYSIIDLLKKFKESLNNKTSRGENNIHKL